VQFSDSHIVAPGERSLGVDTAAYLAEAVAFVNTLQPAPDYAVVTGDLVNGGLRCEYAHFVDLMHGLRVPYFAIMGNHDERGAFHAGLPPAVYGRAPAGSIRYAVDDFPLRFIGLDANPPRRSRWPIPSLDAGSLAWLETTLAGAPAQPTLLAVHQPPFRTGLHYFDIFGYPGARRLRSIVRAAPQVGRVICGHIHCVKTLALGGTLVCSAPSTAPQRVPELFEHRILGLRHEVPGFTVHDWSAQHAFSSTVYRRVARATFAAQAALPLATRR